MATKDGRRRTLWRALSVAPLPLLLGLYALWQDLLRLETAGLRVRWDRDMFVNWVVMALGTLLVVALFWSRKRPLRILGYAFHSLLLSFGFGAAGVIAVVNGLGGPHGDLGAPTWALVTLAATALACALAVLADAALLVADIRAGDAEEG
jgi:hypothetical protein